MNKWSFIDEKFKSHKLQYILQSALATLIIIIILSFLDVIRHTAIIATLGATAFIVYTMPHAYISKTRVLTGAYLIGIITGCLCSLASDFLSTPAIGSIERDSMLFGGLAVGIAILLMVITNTEHPPAAGMALSLVLNKWDWTTVAFILVAVITMGLLKKALKPKLIDLI